MTMGARDMMEAVSGHDIIVEGLVVAGADRTGAQGAAVMVDLANTVLPVGGGAVKLMTGQISRQTAILETSLSAGGTVDLVNDL